MKKLALLGITIFLYGSVLSSQVGAPLTPGSFSNQNGNGSSTGNQTINGNLTVNGTETINVPSGSTGLTINGNQDSVFHTYVGANNNNGTGAYADFRLTAGTGVGNIRNAYVGVSSPNVAAGAAGGSRAWLDTGANSSTGWDYISAVSGGNHRFYTDGYADSNLRATIDSSGVLFGTVTNGARINVATDGFLRARTRDNTGYANFFLSTLYPENLIVFSSGTQSIIQNTNDGVLNFTNNGQTTGVSISVSGAPTIASGFGTTPSIASDSSDVSGEVNVGTGGSASAGILNFARTHTKAPRCIAGVSTSSSGNVRAMGVTTSTTQMQLTAASAWAASSIVWYSCWEPK